MRHLSGNYYKAAVGLGMVVLIASISASLMLWQRDDGPGPKVGREVSTAAELGLPAPSGRMTIDYSEPESSGTNTADAFENGPFELEIQRNAPRSAFIPTVSEVESAEGEDSIEAGRFNVGDGATMSDWVDLDAKGAQAPPSPNSPGDSVNFADSAGLVVRSASGEIKQEETAK